MSCFVVFEFVDVISVGHDRNRFSGWWYVCSVNVGERTPHVEHQF